jgi:hypothetical protein
MGWPLELDQILVIAVGAGVILLLVSVVLLVRRRRRRAPVTGFGFDLATYQGRNPGFVHALQAIADRGLLEELSRRGDVRAALRLLKERGGAQRPRKRDRRTSLLDRPPPVDQRVDAAILTILRAVYMDEGLRRAVPGEAQREIDRYLDGLTG